MPKSTEVFTPNDVPTFSYVERKARRFEERLRESLTIPKMIVSLSGPSKSGKTVLVKKVIDEDNLIPLSGATIRSADALWVNVLNWMSIPSERVETTGSPIKSRHWHEGRWCSEHSICCASQGGSWRLDGR
jgi:hypothetical protein